MKLKWYYYRLKSMSLPEIAFRFRERIIHWQDTRKLTGYFPPQQELSSYQKILNIPDIDHPVIAPRLEIFEKELDYSGTIDWHYDLKTGNRFPESNSFKIDIRTPKFGSAKHVWEVNRLAFLAQLCVNYRTAGDLKFLNRFMELVNDWKENNPYLKGVNWYSNIEVNIRLINWFVCWEILDAPELIKKNEQFRTFTEQVWIPLVYLHCRHSRRHPSRFSSANNHLISEYAGLFIAASVWDFKESEQWKKYAKNGLEKEIILQHTNNGINREEAAEYIQFITDFFLIAHVVAEKTNNSFSSGYTSMLKKIGRYIFEFTDDEGNYPKYGDEDDGQILRFGNKLDNNFLSVLFSLSVLFNEPELRAKRAESDLKNRILLGSMLSKVSGTPALPKLNSKFYTNDGHFVLRNTAAKNKCYIHFNAAPLGYLSIAGHGHADALSFVLHLNNKPVFIDPGTYTYHTEPERRIYFISTLAHNTVCINGMNQAKFGGSTLWVSKYKSVVHDANSDDELDYIHASHNGYKHLGVSVERKIHYHKKENKLIIEDIIHSKNTKDVSVEIPFHLHPDTKLTETTTGFILNSGSDRIKMTPDGQLDYSLVSGSENPPLGWYSESFQKLKPTSVIHCRKLVKASATFKTEISILEN